jgi:hypothetical protein
MWSRTNIQRTVAVACGLLIGLPATFAQTQGDPAMPDTQQAAPDTQQGAPLLSPDQLNNLVAPIALYPDPLLSQVLSASTYPLEIMEAQQWLGQNRNLQGSQLAEAARQQNWDPSVQALVVFPNALGLLANDVRWTTDLGNAFLAQQADVMGAVQRMRTRARANGKLNNTPQQVVTTATQDGQDAIEIQPADPQVIYVPVYRPSYVWGPPAWGAYPDMWYPSGFGFGFGFGPGYYMSSYYPGWGGWGGWGWGCGWFGGGLYVNAGFFNHYGYRGGYGGYGGYGGGNGFGGRSAWTHDPGHRMGVAYPNRMVSNRFSGGSMNGRSFGGSARTGGGGQWNGSARQGASQINRAGGGAAAGGTRSPASGGWQRFGDSNRPQTAARSNASGVAGTPNSGAGSGNRGNAGSYRQPSSNYPANGGSRSYQSPAQNYRSAPSSGQSSSPNNYSAPRGGGSSAPRSYAAPSQSYSAPRSSSGPRASGGGSGYSGGHSGGNSGSSGGQSSGGGGHRR